VIFNADCPPVGSMTSL